MKNDLSFVIGATMNLYEHQSTSNANLPLRDLIYFERLSQAIRTAINSCQSNGISKLFLLLLNDNRNDDLRRAAEDKNFQDELFHFYGI